MILYAGKVLVAFILVIEVGACRAMPVACGAEVECFLFKKK